MSNYTDGIRVKISERFKPPHKINLAMTYAQRLTLNKQIEENLPNYEFLLEKTVIDKMKEWKTVRSSLLEERNERLVRVREELLLLNKQKELDDKEAEEQQNSEVNTSKIYSSVSNQNYSVNTSNILIPTQATTNTYSNILTPIPLDQKYSVKSVDKSPFNISDFEDDTSSPFDNMELKSINDMEELAQVLKKDNHSYNYQNVQQPHQQQMQPNYNQFIGNHYTYNNIPTNPLPYTHQPPDYPQSHPPHTNGYFYPSEVLPTNNSFSSNYLYSKQTPVDYFHKSQPKPEEVALQEARKNCRSVPDIVKALQVELDNSHIDNNSAASYVSQSGRPKSTDAVYPKAKIKVVEELEDPFNLLPKNLQDMCKSISSMGFPLARVARACQVLGDDHKKILEHLLALSDLLDLGFLERDISNALMQCNNDKDKALDKLIS